MLVVYPPVGFAPVVFVALVPLLELMRTAGGRRLAGWAFAGGLVFYFPALSWLRFITAHAAFAGWVLLAVYLALFTAAFAVCGRLLVRTMRVPVWIACPVVWSGLEYGQSRLLDGFPWFLLGHGASGMLLLVQVADVGGTAMVGAVVVLVNVGVHEFLLAAWDRGRGAWRRAARACGIAAAAVALTLGYGLIRWQSPPMEQGPGVTLIQANIPLDRELELGLRDPLPGEEEEAAVQAFKEHGRLTRKAGTPPGGLVIWPESACSMALNDESPWGSRWSRVVSNLAIETGLPLLVGSSSYFPKTPARGTESSRNSAFLFLPDGSKPMRYDKIVLVPFGEYNALEKFLPPMAPLLERIVPYETENLAPGPRRQPLFPLGPWRFGVLICFEDTISYLARDLRRDGADFLVTITNDTWFGETGQLEQHLAAARLRCIETRLPMARATNSGISAIIDPLGRLSRILEVGGQTKGVGGILRGALPMANPVPETLFVRFGDWWGMGCAATGAALTATAVFLRIRPRKPTGSRPPAG